MLHSIQLRIWKQFSQDTLSKIGQVKDVFPSFGDGFLAKCLDTFGNNPEVVIDR